MARPLEVVVDLIDEGVHLEVVVIVIVMIAFATEVMWGWFMFSVLLYNNPVEETFFTLPLVIFMRPSLACEGLLVVVVVMGWRFGEAWRCVALRWC